MNRNGAIVLPARLVSALALLAGPPGAELLAFQLPAGSVNQRVTVQGRLELAGRNYFRDPRFVIVDDQGDRIPVAPWAPLEFPPDPPGTASSGRDKLTMQGFLQQRFSFTAIHRTIPAGRPDLPGSPGQGYLEVQLINDTVSGATVFTAPGGLSPGAGFDPNAGPPAAGAQPSGPPQPVSPASPPSGGSAGAQTPQPTSPAQPVAARASVPSVVPEPTAPAKPASARAAQPAGASTPAAAAANDAPGAGTGARK